MSILASGGGMLPSVSESVKGEADSSQLPLFSGLSLLEYISVLIYLNHVKFIALIFPCPMHIHPYTEISVYRCVLGSYLYI